MVASCIAFFQTYPMRLRALAAVASLARRSQNGLRVLSRDAP